MRLIRLVLVLIIGTTLSVSSIALTGCNTVEGAGEDVESTGEAMQDAAD